MMQADGAPTPGRKAATGASPAAPAPVCRPARAPAWLTAAARRTIDLLLPPSALDGGARPFAPGLSPGGWSRIEWLDEPVCDGCGLPFAYPQPGRCPACEARPRAFARARCACLYDEASRALVLRLKHGDRTDYAPLFARWLSRAAAPLLPAADWIAPVPMARGRLFRRRFNQAAEIARPLARLSGRPYLPDALVRVKPGGQAGKSRRGRREAVRAAFQVTPAGARRVAGRRILLVDDVFTTGATAEACARALLAAGAAAVDLAAVARVREASEASI